MIVLNPDVVRFEEFVWEDCSGVSVDRGAERLVEEWNDSGPHAAFADVPERSVRVKVTRELERSEPGIELGAAMGRVGWLRFYTSGIGSDAGRLRVSVRCVLASVKTELIHAAGSKNGTPTARQTITLVGVSPDGGSQDPVQVASAVVTD